MAEGLTKAAAADVLGVPVTASRQDIERRYQEVFNEFSVRLTHAPTAALRETFQKNLREVQAAVDVLAPGLRSASDELPASTPVGGVEIKGRTPQPPIEKKNQPVEDPSWPRSTLLAASVAVVAVAALSLFVMLWAKERARVATASQAVLKPAFLEVCNRSAKPVRIEAVVSMFTDAEGKLRTIHSGSFDYPTWDLAPGERKRLSVLRGTRDDWDGTSAIYALMVAYAGKEPFLVAGLMSEARDGCANLFLD